MEQQVENTKTETKTSEKGLFYDLFVLLPNIVEDEIEAETEKIKSVIEEEGGKINEISALGKRKLSYVIDKVRHGFYINFKIEIDTDKIDNLKKELKLMAEVLRFQLTIHRSAPIKKFESTVLAKEEGVGKEENKQGDNENKQEDKEKEKNSKKDDGEKGKSKITIDELDKKLDNILNDQEKI